MPGRRLRASTASLSPSILLSIPNQTNATISGILASTPHLCWRHARGRMCQRARFKLSRMTLAPMSMRCCCCCPPRRECPPASRPLAVLARLASSPARLGLRRVGSSWESETASCTLRFTSGRWPCALDLALELPPLIEGRDHKAGPRSKHPTCS